MSSKAIIISVVITVICVVPFLAVFVEDSQGSTTNDIDVFLMAGQSNAAYTFRADSSTATPICQPGVAYYYGTSTSPQYTSTWSTDFDIHDMVDDDGSPVIGGIEQPFASTYHQETGNKVCVLNIAIGGSSINKWTTTGSFYTLLQNFFASAMDHLVDMGFTPHVKSLIWLQGESDPNMGIEEYKTEFLAMFNSMSQTGDDAFNSTYTIDSCIIGLVRQSTGKNSCLAQIQLDAQNENIRLGCISADLFTQSNGLLESDNLHYTQLGRNQMAVNLAKTYIEHFD